MREKIAENYGYLFENDLQEEIAKYGIYKEIKEGDILLNYDDEIPGIPLLLNGAIKILRCNDAGDELVLYYLESGDTCSITLSCSLKKKKSEIKAIAEVNSELVIVPLNVTEDWTRKYKGWMNFVLNSYSERLNEMLGSIDGLVFTDMHQRLHRYLKDKVLLHKTTSLEVTHQEIANDMNSSRVVISRLLKKLEKENKLKLFRNKIEVIEF